MPAPVVNHEFLTPERAVLRRPKPHRSLSSLSTSSFSSAHRIAIFSNDNSKTSNGLQTVEKWRPQEPQNRLKRAPECSDRRKSESIPEEPRRQPRLDSAGDQLPRVENPPKKHRKTGPPPVQFWSLVGTIGLSQKVELQVRNHLYYAVVKNGRNRPQPSGTSYGTIGLMPNQSLPPAGAAFGELQWNQ